MAVRVVGVGTALPPYGYEQGEVKAIMQAWIGGERRVDRTLERVYAASAIERRWSVLPDFADAKPLAGTGPEESGAPVADGALFTRDGAGCMARPTTGERNDRYGVCAPPLVERAARRALAASPASLRERVTHVVTVSCTGFQAPGLDDHLVRALGLAPTTERYHLGFMGCYAAFPALRMAHAFCLADPDAVVLIAAVELCTLHLDPKRDVDSILATSVFADGAAAAVVTAAGSDARSGAAAGSDARSGAAALGVGAEGKALHLEMVASTTTLTRDGRSDMAWTIGDHGFEMVLSAYVPRVLEAEAEAAVAPLLRAGNVNVSDIDAWAVHPGGRAILDKLEAGLRLPAAALAPSRAVLASAGNMSSATVLFVLQRLLGGRCEDLGSPGPEDTGVHAVAPGAIVAALAFGPGLTVDAALLRAVRA